MTAALLNDLPHTKPPALCFGRRRRHPELERLICAAAIDPRFAALLVANPAQALRESELGAKLSADEQAMVLSINNARDIHDFAGRLYDAAYSADADRVSA
jgi:hypothetical protein